MDFPTTSLQDKHRYRLLSLLLSIFHLSVWYSDFKEFLLPLMLMHFGLFLFWQPIWSRKQEIKPLIALVFALFIGGALWFSGLWFLMLWSSLLVGFLGCAGENSKEKIIHILAALYLLIEMIVIAAPKLFQIDVFSEGTDLNVTADYIFVSMFFLPIPLLFFSSKQEIYRAHHSDLFRGLVLSLIAMLLVVGGVLRHIQGNIEYFSAVFHVLVIMGVSLTFIAWVWNPGMSYKGLFFVWNRYLLNVGTPVEDFLYDLTQVAQNESDPADFLSTSLKILTDLDWVDGLQWRSAVSKGEYGEVSGVPMDLSYGDLRLTLFSKKPMSSSLVLHSKLLIHILAYFYISKQRERKLSQKAHLEAIYETGARLTHDMKNLLQSLSSLSAVIEASNDEDANEVLSLVKRQLPAINERLNTTLDKMASPEIETQTKISVDKWWERLLDRNVGRQITFSNEAGIDVEVYQELFDTVADNFLDNARVKRLTQKDIDIEFKVYLNDGKPCLSVHDTGWPVDQRMENKLFSETVGSATGMGIGLYQANVQAKGLKYHLLLKSNLEGDVCFALESL